MLLIDAANIAPGGTLVLLEQLVAALIVRATDFRVLARTGVARRFPRAHAVVYDRFPLGRRRLLSRLVVETGAGVVLHFGNLATARPLPGVRQVVYFHNLNIVFPGGGGTNGWLRQVRNHMMASWLRQTRRHVDTFYVQTEYVRSLLTERFGVDSSKTVVRPFYPAISRGEAIEGVTPDGDFGTTAHYDFVYAAAFYPHKNFECLLEAMRLLAAEDGVYPTLALITEHHPGLLEMLEKCLAAGARVTCTGSLSHQQCLALVAQAGAVVFPSLLESLGLPLVEAAALGKPIIAADRPYVHAAVVPSASFDPTDADALRRCMKDACQSELAPAQLILTNHLDTLLTELDEQRSMAAATFAPYRPDVS